MQNTQNMQLNNHFLRNLNLAYDYTSYFQHENKAQIDIKNKIRLKDQHNNDI